MHCFLLILPYNERGRSCWWVILFLWTAATNGPVDYPSCDIWAWRSIVEWNRQGKLISPPELSGAATSTHLVASRKNGRRKLWIWHCEILLFIHQVLFFYMPYVVGTTALLPFRRKASCGFISHLKSITKAGFEPANLVSSGKHANHYTTEATRERFTSTQKWYEIVKYFYAEFPLL
jgi:hypothetical protein